MFIYISALNSVQAQLPLQNIPCTGCTVNASTGYTTAAAAVAGTGAPTTNYTLAPNTTFTQCATVKTDPNGTVGIIDLIVTTQPTGNTTCTPNTAASRKGSLYLASGTACTGPEIQAFRKGSNSSTFNPEYVGLTPNTNYILVIQTTVDGSCTQYQSSSVKYYGSVTPQFTFNCAVSSSTGTFIVGTSSSGTLTVGITGTTAGSATFNVSGTNFSGTLTTTLTAGQTSVNIPITYTGTGVAGSRTLSVTSSNGGGTCSKSVLVDIDTDGDGIPDSTDLDDDNDGILDKVEKNCGINQTWTSLGSGVWQSNLTPSLKVKVTLGNYATAWSNDIALTNFNRACTEASYTSDYAPIVNTNLPAFQFNKTVGASIGTITVEYLDASNTPVTIKNPRFHLGGLGGSFSGVVASSDWTLQGGKTMATLSKDATDFGTTATTIFHPRLGQASGTVNDCASGEGSGTLQIDGSMSSFSFSVKANGGFFDQMVMAFEACVDADTDNDGIANYLDLDSDGDGCPDAIEGGANFAASTLVTSTLAGGNSGTGYTGTSISPVTKNLGNTVGSTATTLGVPTVATTGQTVGNSANKLVQSANCPVACVAGTTAPAISATTATNTCPTTTVSLAGLANTGTKPTGTTLIWSTHKIPTSLGDTLTNLTTVSTAGKYYALYFDKVNSCYSPADSVVVSLTVCANNPLAQSGLVSQAKTGTASSELTPTGGNGTYVYSVDNSCTPVSGATALPSASNLTVTNSTTGAYTYTTPAAAGTYYFCIKVCDTSTPTPNCVTKTYTLTVAAAACVIGTAVPSLK